MPERMACWEPRENCHLSLRVPPRLTHIAIGCMNSFHKYAKLRALRRDRV
jgi:hypothetical protein